MIRNLIDVVEHLDGLKLFGEKRKFIESQQNTLFEFILHIEKIERTIGIGLSDKIRGGNTIIGKTDGIDVGVLMMNTESDLKIGQNVEIISKMIGYRPAVRRFEFVQI